jgi:hypothetical protein
VANRCCQGPAASCTANSDCCSNACTGGTCWCLPVGSVCVNQDQCCPPSYCGGNGAFPQCVL